jgi:hypothetical protein
VVTVAFGGGKSSVARFHNERIDPKNEGDSVRAGAGAASVPAPGAAVVDIGVEGAATAAATTVPGSAAETVDASDGVLASGGPEREGEGSVAAPTAGTGCKVTGGEGAGEGTDTTPDGGPEGGPEGNPDEAPEPRLPEAAGPDPTGSWTDKPFNLSWKEKYNKKEGEEEEEKGEEKGGRN